MSLSNILDEIQGGAVYQETTVPEGLEETTLVVGLEHLEGLPVLVERAEIFSRKNMIERLLKVALSHSILDKSTALELFTMLPGRNPSALTLTSVPSRHNRQQLISAVHPEEGGGVQEYHLFMCEVKNMVEGSLQFASELRVTAQLCAEIVSKRIELFDNKVPPLIVHQGKTKNLLEIPIGEVVQMDTSVLEYTPYEGTLNNTFRKLTAPEGIFFTHNVALLTLRSYAQEFLTLCESVTALHGFLEKTCEDLAGSMASGYYPANLVSEALKSMGEFPRYKALFFKEDNAAKNLMDCLSFLV